MQIIHALYHQEFTNRYMFACMILHVFIYFSCSMNNEYLILYKSIFYQFPLQWLLAINSQE